MKALLFVSMVLVATACSKSKGGAGGIPGAGLPELTAEQQQKTSRVNNALQDISVVTDFASTQKDTSSSSLLNSGVTIQSQLTKAQVDLQQKMQAAVDDSTCVITATGNDSAQDILQGPIQMSTAISGVQCPVVYSASLNGKADIKAGGAHVSMSGTESFSLSKTSTAKLFVDVTDYSTNFKANMDVSGDETNQNMKSTTEAAMKLNSMTLGAVDVVFSQQSNTVSHVDPVKNTMTMQMTQNITATQSFKDFKAVGYVVLSMNMSAQGMSSSSTQPAAQQTAEYYINGKTATEEEFRKVFGNFEMVVQ